MLTTHLSFLAGRRCWPADRLTPYPPRQLCVASTHPQTEADLPTRVRAQVWGRGASMTSFPSSFLMGPWDVSRVTACLLSGGSHSMPILCSPLEGGCLGSNWLVSWPHLICLLNTSSWVSQDTSQVMYSKPNSLYQQCYPYNIAGLCCLPSFSLTLPYLGFYYFRSRPPS